METTPTSSPRTPAPGSPRKRADRQRQRKPSAGRTPVPVLPPELGEHQARVLKYAKRIAKGEMLFDDD